MTCNPPPTHRPPTATALLLGLGLATCGHDVSLSELPTDDSGASGSSMIDPTESSPPAAPTLQLDFVPIKQFEFTWAAADGAAFYQLLERTTADGEYTQLGEDIFGTAVAHTMPLHLRFGSSYVLRACNAAGCTDSAALEVVDSMASAIGYVKPSTVGPNHQFGGRIALSSDGTTLAVGVWGDSSAATGIDGGEADNTAYGAGAVYVFVRTNDAWSQQAYIKASNTDANDRFGFRVALSADGNTLAVGAAIESSTATGVDGDQLDNSTTAAGAAYVYVRDNHIWSQQAYIKASNTAASDLFGRLALSADGDTLAVGAVWEDSAATGVGGDQADDNAEDAGAVYVFVRTNDVWSQQAYLKASNADPGDEFGNSLALSSDGDTLVVSAPLEDSSAAGVGGDQQDDAAVDSGAVYVFVRADSAWSQQAFLKASTVDADDQFGWDLTLSGDGNTLAVGSGGEDSAAVGVDGDEADDSAPYAGSVHVFVRANGAWSQQAFIKASNTAAEDAFGDAVSLSADGMTLAIGAQGEDSPAVGVGGEQGDGADQAGAVYIFTRADDTWAQRAYVKAPNTEAKDAVARVALSTDGCVESLY